FSSRRRHTRFSRDWSSDVCSSDLDLVERIALLRPLGRSRGLGSREDEFVSTPIVLIGQCDVFTRRRLQIVLEPVRLPREIAVIRSEERRVGKEGGPPWARAPHKKE